MSALIPVLVMAAHAGMGIDLKYLLAATFMAAPGGLLFAKIILPETGKPRKAHPDDNDDATTPPANVLDAAAVGASDGLRLALNVGAMLLAGEPKWCADRRSAPQNQSENLPSKSLLSFASWRFHSSPISINE